MDSTMMYLHVKKIGNESVDPVKNWCTAGNKVGLIRKFFSLAPSRYKNANKFLFFSRWKKFFIFSFNHIDFRQRQHKIKPGVLSCYEL